MAVNPKLRKMKRSVQHVQKCEIANATDTIGRIQTTNSDSQDTSKYIQWTAEVLVARCSISDTDLHKHCRRQQIHITRLQKIQQDKQSNNKADRGGGGALPYSQSQQVC